MVATVSLMLPARAFGKPVPAVPVGLAAPEPGQLAGSVARTACARSALDRPIATLASVPRR